MDHFPTSQHLGATTIMMTLLKITMLKITMLKITMLKMTMFKMTMLKMSTKVAVAILLKDLALQTQSLQLWCQLKQDHQR